MLAARDTGVVGNMHSVLRDILQPDPRVQLDNENDGCQATSNNRDARRHKFFITPVRLESEP